MCPPSMHNFTESVLVFWRRNWRKFPTWAKAASIVFSMTPNSAGAERVFSFLKLMFGDTRTTALAGLIEGSLMLKYNKQCQAQGGEVVVGCWRLYRILQSCESV